jgi:hypothetical protein
MLSTSASGRRGLGLTPSSLRSRAVCFESSLAASTAAAQDAFHNEIGIIVGLTVLGDSSAITSVGVPGAGGALGPGALYAARIQRPWIFEAHFSVNHLSGAGMKFTQVYLALQADYLNEYGLLLGGGVRL